MALERWIIPQKSGRHRTLLVPEGAVRVQTSGDVEAMADGPAVGAAELAHPLRLARTGTAPAIKRRGPVTLSFSVGAVAGATLPMDDDEDPASRLLHYGELCGAFAAVLSELHLDLVAIEAVDFGRLQIEVDGRHEATRDVGAALGLAAIALEELATQRGLRANGLRVEQAPHDIAGPKTPWGAHLAADVVVASTPEGSDV